MSVTAALRRPTAYALATSALVAAACTSVGGSAGGTFVPPDASKGLDATGTPPSDDGGIEASEASSLARCVAIDPSSLQVAPYPVLLSSGDDVYVGGAQGAQGVWYLPPDSATPLQVTVDGTMVAADATYLYYLANDSTRTLTAASVHGAPTKTFGPAGTEFGTAVSNGTTLFVERYEPDSGSGSSSLSSIDIATGVTHSLPTLASGVDPFASDTSFLYLSDLSLGDAGGFVRMTLADAGWSDGVPTAFTAETFALSDGWVYAGGGALGRAPANLTSGFTTILSLPRTPTTGISAGPFAADGTDVYFGATIYDDAGRDTSVVGRVPADGSSPPTVFATVPAASGAVDAVAVTSDCVVWGTALGTTLGVYRQPKH